MGKKLELTGNKYGLLTVKKFAGIRRKFGFSEWECECECGNTTIVRGTDLTRGYTKSCGCLRRKASSERTAKVMYKHGLSHTRVYRIYQTMMRHCYSKRVYNYKFYGAKGITVCDEWKDDFLTFYDWAMKNGYDDTKILNRYDKKGNYEPSNCFFGEEIIK